MSLKAEDEYADAVGAWCEMNRVRPEDIVAELDRRSKVAFEKAVAEQKLAAKDCSEVRALKCSDGSGGYLDFRVHKFFYHYWGQRLGTYDCWTDKAFVRSFLEKNTECRVKLITDTVITPGLAFAAGGIAV